MSNTDLTAEDVKKILNYYPNTGELVWQERIARCVQIGDIAGCVDNQGYVTVGIRKRIYKAHRLAWLITHGIWPIGLIDHIDGNKSNNRLSNLRLVNETGNAENVRRPNKRNKSGFMGVIWFQNKWRASITIKHKTKWLGDYATPEEAHQVYLDAKRSYHNACTI
jgi:hypothetical protein